MYVFDCQNRERSNAAMVLSQAKITKVVWIKRNTLFFLRCMIGLNFELTLAQVVGW